MTGFTCNLMTERKALLSAPMSPMVLRLEGEVGARPGLGSQASWTIAHACGTVGCWQQSADIAIFESAVDKVDACDFQLEMFA